MTTLAEQIRTLSDRLQAILEADPTQAPDAAAKERDEKFTQLGKGLKATAPGQLPVIQPTGTGAYMMRTAETDELVWIYGTKPDPACTEPVKATFNGRPVTVMKMPGIHPDHESRGYIAK
jgi:hypothetical protein